MNDPGTDLIIPGYEITIVGGLGDGAVWVRTDADPANVEDGLLVQHGLDIVVLGAPDAADTQTKFNGLAQATPSSA